MSRSKKSITEIGEPGLGVMMVAAELEAHNLQQVAGRARLELDMTKIGVEGIDDLVELALLRRRLIPRHRLDDYEWIHKHICEYLKQFHPSENQALLEQARTAR